MSILHVEQMQSVLKINVSVNLSWKLQAEDSTAETKLQNWLRTERLLVYG